MTRPCDTPAWETIFGHLGQVTGRPEELMVMADIVNLDDAKTNLSDPVDRAAAGEKIVIA